MTPAARPRTCSSSNTGLYQRYPDVDPGLWEFTFAEADRGRFRPPSLRNVAVTAPYMHDGSVATLEEVVAIYERGGRAIATGPNAGDGRDNPNKSPLVAGFPLSDQERADLLAFLRALTDDHFLTDPTLADPFAPAPQESP
jgi:cytochrome c peroxidase